MSGFIRAGATLVVYSFFVIVAYFVLSSPVAMLFDAFDDADVGAANSEMDQQVSISRSIFSIFFALAFAIAPTWFIVWVMHREPQYWRR